MCCEENVTAGKNGIIWNYELNLGFFKSKSDQCSVCEAYNNASDAEKNGLQV